MSPIPAKYWRPFGPASCQDWLRALSIVLLLHYVPAGCMAADEPPPGNEAGQLLAAEFRSRIPVEDLFSRGMLAIRDAEGQRRDVPVIFSVIRAAETWISSYETAGGEAHPAEKLTIIHHPQGTNDYWYQISPNPQAPSAPRLLSAEDLATPFAGSDFWLIDLGLDFFHWPIQRLVKKEMRKSRTCNVLESVNPAPNPASYARVVSWLDIETGGLLLAEAYDKQHQLIKEFSVRSFRKIQGQWHLKEMEICRPQKDSRTRLQFDLRLRDAAP